MAREMSRLGADVVHGPDFAVPYMPRRPSVMTLHDLSPWLDPAWHHGAGRVMRRTPVLLKMGLATMMVTPGERGAQAGHRAVSAQPGARCGGAGSRRALWFAPRGKPRPAAPYFLFVGTLEPRKNLPLLVEAWREVRRAHPVDLVVAGRRRADCAADCRGTGLRMSGEVPDAAVAGALFRRAGLRLPVALRRLRPAGAGGHAVRRLRDRLARPCAETAGRRGGLCRERARTGAAMRGAIERPDGRPNGAPAAWPAPPNSPGSGRRGRPARSTRRRGGALETDDRRSRPCCWRRKRPIRWRAAGRCARRR